ncbi:MAG: FAD:protein FMN transferase, partial [Defluviitaleaceae bacterium]|nr:FAD:protein FMN transferase [Defluviitaleaceae bacterium]
MKKYIKFLIAKAALVATFMMAGCGSSQQEVVYRNFTMDTLATIHVFYEGTGSQSQQDYHMDIAREAFAIVQEVEEMFDRFNPNSYISRINNAGGEYVEVHPYVITVLEKSQYFREITNGAFDITVGRVMDLWDFTGEQRIPSERELAEAMETVGSDIIISGNRVRLENPDTIIDVGGIAKGFASDVAGMFLYERGVAGIVNLGGDTFLAGNKPDGTPWALGIRKPSADLLSDENYGHFELWGNIASATSGVTERHFFHEGRRMHHKINTTTGWPIETEVTS